MDPLDRSIEERIRGLADATESISARTDFEDRVLIMISHLREPDWNSVLVRVGLVALAAALPITLIAALLARGSRGNAETAYAAAAASYANAEQDW